MVNTTMNHSKEFKKMKYTWIDIDAPRQEVHFKPINESEETKSKLSIDNKTSENENLKTKILASTLYNLVKKQYQSNIVLEARKKGENPLEDNNVKNKTLYSTSQWHEFENNAKIILTFLNTNQKQANETI